MEILNGFASLARAKEKRIAKESKGEKNRNLTWRKSKTERKKSENQAECAQSMRTREEKPQASERSFPARKSGKKVRSRRTLVVQSKLTKLLVGHQGSTKKKQSSCDSIQRATLSIRGN